MNPAATGSAQMLYDIWPGDQGSDPRYLTAAGGRMVFYARDNTYGPEIWSTDGTEINTVMLKDLYQGKLGSAPRNFAYFNGMVYFSATGFLGGASETVLGEELWRYNPSNQESSLVEDINKQNSGYDSSNPYSLYPLGNTLFFGANDGVHGYELWKHTAAGETAMVKDAATIGSGIDSINPWMASIGNKLFYRGTDGQNGNELWQSDGTEPGTFMVANIHASGNSNPFRMTPIGGKLYFSATNSSGLTQLWRYDPGTVGLVDLSAGLGSSSQGLYPQYYAVAGATLYFQGRDDAHGIELWKHDTGTGVTMMVEDVWPGTSSGEPSFLTTVGNLVYFTAKSQDHGQELWVHDTIGGATSMVRDIMPGTAGAGITGMTVHGNRLYFQADDGVNGKELWATNETGDNACMAGNTAPGAVSSSPTYLYEWNGRLYFKAYTPELGTELWYVE
jgi:ELWxxDGT repeat protein